MNDQGCKRLIRIWGVVIHVAMVSLLVGPAGVSADPPTVGKVRVPLAPSVPSPMVNPEAAITLTPELVLCVDSDVDCVVVCSPKGRLKITPAKGPVTVRGKFVDGPGTVEMRTFAGPFVWFVESAEAGECELLVLPVGGREPDMVRRRIISQTGPQPPPKPDPDVPDPKPKPPEPVTSFRVIFVYESSAAMTPAVQRVMFGEKVRTFLDVKTTAGPKGDKGWRRFDKDVVATNDPDPAFRSLWEAAKPKVTTVPCVVIAVNDKAEIVPLPADEDAAIVLFNKYLGK